MTILKQKIMEKEKLISLLNEYKDIPEKIVDFIHHGEIDSSIETTNLIASTIVRMNSTSGKENEYYKNIYNVEKKNEKMQYVSVKSRSNKAPRISIHLNIEGHSILYIIYDLDEKLHPGLYMPGGGSIEQWKPDNWV